MKFFKWTIETIVCNFDYTFESYSFDIETLGNSKSKAIEIAMLKTKKELRKQKKKIRRINICWLEAKGFRVVSKYQQFVRLIEKKKTRKTIMNMLRIPFWKLREYEEYYYGRTKNLTRSKYQQERKRLTNEKIRRKYKIPECEFNSFLRMIQPCVTT